MHYIVYLVTERRLLKKVFIGPINNSLEASYTRIRKINNSSDYF